MTISIGAERAKLYRERNPERWNETLRKYWKKRYMCECGIEVCNKIKSQHKRTKKHMERMEFLDKVKVLSDKVRFYEEKDNGMDILNI